MDDRLYVVAPLFNPGGFETRDRLFQQFATYVRDSGGILVPAECATGDRPFRSADLPGPAVRVRADQWLWLKENLINLGLVALPPSARYVCWVDTDVQFVRPDWVSATVQALQRHAIVQMFSQALYLTPSFEPYQRCRGFAWCFVHGRPHGRRHDFWFPGGAWATTRERVHAVGGLLDRTLGAADHHMAYALLGRVLDTVQCPITRGHEKVLRSWESRAVEVFDGRVGYVGGTLLHFWHGCMASRQYLSRWAIIDRHRFDPLVDLGYRLDGLLELTGAGQRLAADLEAYFRVRDEDALTVPDGEVQEFFRPVFQPFDS
jgi:hypothetical protein